MSATNPTIYAVLFSLSIVLTYLTVRNGWLRLPTLWVGGLLVNTPFFCLYSLTRPLLVAAALLSGVFLSLAFSSATILLGQFFRRLADPANAPAEHVLLTENRSG